MRKGYLLGALLLTGCATDLPTYVNDIESPFDGNREVSVSSGFVKENSSALSGAPFKLGAAWLEKFPNELQIEAEVFEIINLTKHDGLQFNIDGETVKVSSPTPLTTHKLDGTYSTSTRIYIAEIGLLDKLVEAQSVKVRLSGDGGYRVGDFSVGGIHTAKSGFQKLQAALKGKIK